MLSEQDISDFIFLLKKSRMKTKEKCEKKLKNG